MDINKFVNFNVLIIVIYVHKKIHVMFVKQAIIL